MELDQNLPLKRPNQVTCVKLSNSQASQILSCPLLDLPRLPNFYDLLFKTVIIGNSIKNISTHYLLLKWNDFYLF